MMLRPSQFQANSGSSSDSERTFKLKPSSLSVSSTSNSIEKPEGTSETKNNSNNSDGTTTTESPFKVNNLFNNPFGRDEESPKPSNKDPEKKDETAKVDENLDPLTKLNSGALPRSNLFNVKASTLSSSETGFVFGQNISERVIGNPNATAADERTKELEKLTAEPSENVDANSSSGLLFSSGITNTSSVEVIEQKEVDGQSLLEATRKYEEKVKVQKRKYEEVETKTGEEDERNVYEIACKIFAFVASNYEERGRGMLRLNDSKVKAHESRVVFRTSGNLRVLINTKVWSGMAVEKPSNKSIRLTAIDSEGHIKVFLVMARPDDVESLYRYLNERVRKLKALEQERETRAVNMTENDNDKNLTRKVDDGEKGNFSGTCTSNAETGEQEEADMISQDNSNQGEADMKKDDSDDY